MTTTYRPIKKADLKNVARVFVASLNQRHIDSGLAPIVDLEDTEAWTSMWENERRPLFEHVSAHEGAGWLAEDDGEVVGYARSIQRDHVCQLTELFVLPGKQKAGLGRELLTRAFTQVDSPARLILANSNPAALSRYMRAGVYPVCAIFDLEKKAQHRPYETDLEINPMTPGPELEACLNQIDSTLLGYTRPQEHRWLGKQREGFVYTRAGAPVGYAYVGRWSGPMAALEEKDMSAILAHAETVAAESEETFGLMVPVPNRSAMMHALEAGFTFDSGHTMYFMADYSPPGLDRYVFSLPGFFT